MKYSKTCMMANDMQTFTIRSSVVENNHAYYCLFPDIYLHIPQLWVNIPLWQLYTTEYKLVACSSQCIVCHDTPNKCCPWLEIHCHLLSVLKLLIKKCRYGAKLRAGERSGKGGVLLPRMEVQGYYPREIFKNLRHNLVHFYDKLTAVNMHQA